jgi:hypothetical protein
MRSSCTGCGFASRAAIDLWDSEALRALADRQVELARAAGGLTVLPSPRMLQMTVATFDGRLDAAAAACDEIDAIQSLRGQPLPQNGRLFLAAYRGRWTRWSAGPGSLDPTRRRGRRATR